MADKKATNYRELSDKELLKVLSELKGHLREARFEKILGSNFSFGEYKKTKKDVARIKTILGERQRETVASEEK
mgnify:CR=1 FL=1